MIQVDQSYQGDLIDPNTGERLVVRIPSWFGAAALVSATEPIAVPLDIVPTDVPVPTGVWTDMGYLPAGSF